MPTHTSVVPLNDLQRIEPALRAELEEAVRRVLDSGWFVLGPENEALEHELGSYLGTGHCITVGNGTDALQLALTAAGVTAGDTVLTAANAGGYTSTAARALGADPVYADVDPHTHLLTPDTIRAAVASFDAPPRAVVVTHLYGRSAHMQPIMSWAETTGAMVIEDCAQSLGAIDSGQRSGSFGHLATTSFYPTKNLGAAGDGGAVFTSDPETATHIRTLRQYGWSTKYVASSPGGMNSRMDEVQAAILRTKLPHLDSWNDRRRDVHRVYEESVTGEHRLVNGAAPDFVGHLAVIETPQRAAVTNQLQMAGIGTDIHYPVPDHRQPIATGAQPSLATTERLAGSVLSVPLFPSMTPAEIERVATALAQLS